MQTPLPQDDAWDPLKNPYGRRAYERIGSEFGVSKVTNWHVKGANNGLGRVYFYASLKGYIPAYGNLADHYDFTRMTFKNRTSNHMTHNDFLKQDEPNADIAWTTFVLRSSEGFTRAGIGRINDSIRTYVWAILGSQAQTRANILGYGTSFDAQKQFAANIEDAVNSPVDLPSAINRYRDVLRYAGSEVNFVFGIGLYIAPSNVELTIGKFNGYNNEIVIAESGQTLGTNNNINKGLIPVSLSFRTKDETKKIVYDIPLDHSDDKTALILGFTVLGLAIVWFFR